MAKIALIILSVFSVSAFSNELDTPVTNISDRSRLEQQLPATVVVRKNLSTGKSEYLISEDKVPASESSIQALAETGTFAAIDTLTTHELDREGGVASFYFNFNFGYFYPGFYYNYYNYNYAPYYAYTWGGYYYNCFRLWWW